MRKSLLFVPVCALLCSTAVQAQAWSDNFDSYATGSVVGLGGWQEWGAGAGADVVTTQSFSGPNSIDIAGPTDLVHQYTATSGKWVYRTMQYIPSNTVGASYFIMLNTYFTGGPYNWSVQVEFDAASGMLVGDFGASNNGSAPIVFDQWVEVKVFIDLDNDVTEFFYNGEQVGPAYSWAGGVFGAGTGVAAIGAVDLYANSATSVFYDDMELSEFQLESYGAGCPGSQGSIGYNLTLPAQLSTGIFAADVVNLPTPVAANILSLTKVVPPVDLSIIGMTNCSGRVSPDVIVTLGTVPAGTAFTATVAVTIPSNPLLLGLDVHMQAVALDPGQNAANLVVSDAVTFVVLP